VRPLDGVTVISLEQAVAAPFATRQLADLGARVIKVERPGRGDFARGYDESVHGLSSYFVWLNRSKESITLDLKQPAAVDVLLRLLADADVFVHNLGPGAVDRLGLGPDVLAARFPRLIDCGISGFGTDGPWVDRKAYDLIVQSEVGLVSVTGTPADAVKVGISVADIAAGMYGYSGVLAALLQRQLNGRVTPVEVSLFDALAEWMGAPMYYTRYGPAAPARVGAAHATIAPYGPYQAADGTVVLAVQNQAEWTAFCAIVLDDSELTLDSRFARNSDRVANRQLLDGLIAKRVEALTTAEVVTLLEKAGIATARLNSVQGLLDHPVLRERGRWVDVDSPGGSIEALLPPTNLGGVQPRMDPVPAVGQHTDQILAEYGYHAAAIHQLHVDGIV
jgi:crotonobetainyl-CoA:carnitine CoA-transferase CaiB-like acyl-CoA transferase